MLFDQPETVAAAEDRTGRLEVVGGDFFESVPTGADAYLLKYIVHDWDDESEIRILSNCRSAMGNDARIPLVETVVPGPGEPGYAKIADFEMHVLLGSRERTETKFAALLERPV